MEVSILFSILDGPGRRGRLILFPVELKAAEYGNFCQRHASLTEIPMSAAFSSIGNKISRPWRPGPSKIENNIVTSISIPIGFGFEDRLDNSVSQKKNSLTGKTLGREDKTNSFV